MTLEVAKREAQRQADELCQPVHVVRDSHAADPNEPYTTLPQRSAGVLYVGAEVVFTARPK